MSCWIVNCMEWGGECNGPCLRQNVAWHFQMLFLSFPLMKSTALLTVSTVYNEVIDY